MKKIILTGFTGIFLLLVISLGAKAQVASTNTPSSAGLAPAEITSSSSVLVDRNNVNSRVVKNFARSFKNVSNEIWFELQDGFVAKFTVDDINYMVAYDKKGNSLHTIRTYNETKLPPDIRHLVKSSYYDYGITLVQEIEKPLNTITYIIHLDGKTELINLRIRDGEMDEWQKFKKSE